MVYTIYFIISKSLDIFRKNNHCFIILFIRHIQRRKHTFYDCCYYFVFSHIHFTQTNCLLRAFNFAALFMICPFISKLCCKNHLFYPVAIWSIMINLKNYRLHLFGANLWLYLICFWSLFYMPIFLQLRYLCCYKSLQTNKSKHLIRKSYILY